MPANERNATESRASGYFAHVIWKRILGWWPYFFLAISLIGTAFLLWIGTPR